MKQLIIKQTIKKVSLGLLVATLILSGICACSASPEQKAKAAVEKFLKQYKTGSINELTGGDTDIKDNKAAEALWKELQKRLKWEIGEVSKVSDQEYIVKVSIESLDCKELIGQLLLKALSWAFSGYSEEELAQKMGEEIPKLAKEVSISQFPNVSAKVLVKNGQYEVERTDELMNAISGGIEDIANSMLDTFSNIGK